MLTDGFCKEDRKPVQRTLKSQTMSNEWKSGLRKTKTYIQPKIIVPEQHITQMLSHTSCIKNHDARQNALSCLVNSISDKCTNGLLKHIMHKNRAILVHWPCWSLLSTESFKNNRTEQAILSPRAIYLARSDCGALTSANQHDFWDLKNSTSKDQP